MRDAGSMRLRGEKVIVRTHQSQSILHPTSTTQVARIGMATTAQKRAARKNVKKAAAGARKKRTIAHLPKSVRTALGKQVASVVRRKKR